LNPVPAPASFAAELDRTLRLSRHVERVAHARPEVIAELERDAVRPFTREQMQAALAGDAQSLATRLRRLRQRVMVRLAHRDLNGHAPLDEVFATMDALARVCVHAAADEAQRTLAEIHGAPAGGDRLVVAALGKLGGGELNVSSDIDLIFLHAQAGESAGPRAVTHHEFFAAAGRRVIALLAEPTADGIAFRVDMRLRPFGDSGPLVSSLGALEDYFVTHARPWERYAWLKASVIEGPAQGVDALVQPFVYRRYLDYSLLDALRELHDRIFEAALQRRKTDDIKVGPGGIREIEFAVQLFQLVRGGRDAGLRMTSTRGALAALARHGLIEAGRARSLAAAYDFLRRLEHRLQYYDDQQTQALPREAGHRALIAEAMGHADWDALAAELDTHRERVQEAFNALFDRPGAQEGSRARFAAALFDPQSPPDAQTLAEPLAEAGLADPLPVAQRLLEFARSRRYRALSASGRDKLERLLPAVVSAAAAEPNGEIVALRLLDLVEAVAGRESYFALLLEYPDVLARAARLVGSSLWAARLLTRHPILLDELTRSAASFTATDWNAERRQLAREAEALALDVERLLDHLRHYKQRQVLRFTLADVEGELPVMALSDELSALADLLLDVTLTEAGASLGFARGTMPMAAVGYGKLGGKELGYASDLDIVFLYDEAQPDALEVLGRVAQRVITWMTTLTPAGVLYETDLRLRPDGAKGLLVSSVPAFRDYQLKRAWTWEHQALTRARAAAGHRGVGERFERLRDEVLALPRERTKLFEDIVAMRRRMRDEHRKDANEIKHAAGGVIDLEFAVQALVLLHGHAHPRLRENKGNHTLLRRAAELGLLDAAIAIPAADAYLALRARAHAAALNDIEKVVLEAGELAAERAAVKALWSAVFG
jgi:glutamate-ammonia-ligase adenylyltransferase